MNNVRKTVLGPGEVENIYEKRGGEDARLPMNNTEFRKAERFYKLENDLTKTMKLNTFKTKNGVKYYEFESGFIYIPSFLTEKEQKRIVKDTLNEYLAFPSNLNIYVPVGFNVYTQNTTVNYKGKTMNSNNILDKLRWITIGQSYNWTTKEYDSKKYDFPDHLSDLSKKIAKTFCDFDFKPEAGIINYYKQKDSLTGHVDRSELNMNAPLISVSIGKDAVFLIGPDRDTVPDAFVLKSGDVCIMNGKSRGYLHGIPKVLDTNTIIFNDPFIDRGRLNINIRQINF